MDLSSFTNETRVMPEARAVSMARLEAAPNEATTGVFMDAALATMSQPHRPDKRLSLIHI